ncbi:MAG TPA: hypothetical protein VLR26_00840 [Frankiaceae bacterium]|nr:hypothetical protein [Frankiaceae bacterium]
MALAPCGMSWRPALGGIDLTVEPAAPKAATPIAAAPNVANLNAATPAVAFGPSAGATASWAHAAQLPAASAAGRDRRYEIRPRGAPPV